MTFETLTEEEFRTFLNQHPLKTFIQTPEMAKMREKMGYQTYYVGVKKENKIIAATMMGAKKKHFGYYEFYAPRGLLVDYEDYETLSFFTQSLKKMIAQKKGYVLRIDPYYIKQELDIDGNIVLNGINHQKGIENLKKVGFRSSKDIYQQFKYLFALDLKEKKEKIYQNFHTLTKRMIKKAIQNEIEIKEANFEELKEVEAIINETGERKQFSARNLNYYESLYHAFYPTGQVKFLLAYLDLEKYQNKIKQKLEELKKSTSDQKQIEKQQSLLKESQQMKIKNGKVLLSAGVFVLYGQELIYLFGGNKKEYLHLGSSYWMQWTMIQYGLEHGFSKYNFYGIHVPNETDGVYQFKRGFHGYVEELIGDYELPIGCYYFIQKGFHCFKKIK